MKNLVDLPLVLLLIFFIYAAHHAEAAEDQPPAVLDLAGKELQQGARYYILPVIRGRGGGTTLASAGNKTCPLYVAQDPFEVRSGLPLTFTPATRSKGRVIREFTDLNIKFYAETICAQSTVWKLDDYDESTKQYFIRAGGVEGNPGRETISNWFKIEKYENSDYKLVFCPTVCNYCKVICRDVGIFIQDGKRRLALSDVPFRVMFKKA